MTVGGSRQLNKQLNMATIEEVAQPPLVVAPIGAAFSGEGFDSLPARDQSIKSRESTMPHHITVHYAPHMSQHDITVVMVAFGMAFLLGSLIVFVYSERKKRGK